ncbi:hypothetical protein ADIAL_1329 [Alkalibacterium sp. AK22]|nr:hypothetical protein ADIAL_1329 [Alkalibacterium sp. AK22]
MVNIKAAGKVPLGNHYWLLFMMNTVLGINSKDTDKGLKAA